MLPTFVSHMENSMIYQLLCVFQVAKESGKYICSVPPTVSRTSLLKHRRQFCIRNLELFLNHPNHFYTFFVSCTMVRGTCPTLYSSHIHSPLDWHVDTRTHFSARLDRFSQPQKDWDLETLGDALLLLVLLTCHWFSKLIIQSS